MTEDRRIISNIMRRLLLIVAWGCFLAGNANAQVEIVRYVSENGTGDGTSWESASGKLWDVLALSSQVDRMTIYLTEGTYRLRSANVKNVVISGGYSKGGFRKEAQGEHKTIITFSDKTQQDAFYCDNCWAEDVEFDMHLTPSSELRMNNSVLSRCKVYGGRRITGNGQLYGCEIFNCGREGVQVMGGNIFIVENCNIHHNEIGIGGDGILKVKRCDIHDNNNPRGQGGGMFTGAIYQHHVTDCRFANNHAREGGGLYGVNVFLTNCTFEGNTAERSGAAVYLQVNSEMYNCVVWKNGSVKGENIIDVQDVTIKIVNGTIIQNTGTALNVYVRGYELYGEGKSPLIANTVLWGNTKEIENQQNIKLDLRGCAIQGGLGIPELDTACGIINLAALNTGDNAGENYPCFISKEDGDLLPMLSENSTLIDAGDTGLCFTTYDFAYSGRVLLKSIDVGAFEYVSVSHLLAGTKKTFRYSKDAEGIGIAVFEAEREGQKYGILAFVQNDADMMLPYSFGGCEEGKYNFSFQLIDIKNDGMNEVVLYKELPGKKSIVYLLQYRSPGWRVVERMEYVQGKELRPAFNVNPKQPDYYIVKQGAKILLSKLLMDE